MHLNLTPPLLFSLSLFLSPISNLQSPSQAKKAEHSHSTTQRNATDLRSKPQCASLISWSEVTLSLLLFGFQAYWKLYSFHYGIESISIIFFLTYIWIWVHRLWFPLHSLTMYWMSDRFCLFCSLFLILDLDLAFEVQFLFNSTMTKLIIGDLKFRSSLFVSLDIGEEKGVEFIGSFLIWDWMLYYAVT